MRWSLFLHAHLPWVRDSAHAAPLEEDWLHEAIIEVYLPLLAKAEGWQRDQVPGKIALSLTPPLLEMLTDGLLRARTRRRLEGLLRLSERARVGGDSRFQPIATLDCERLARALDRYDAEHGDLVSAFGRLADAGVLEIAASAATHAYLPFFASEPEFVRAQIALGVESHRRHLQRLPRGFWLPECGYAPGLDARLAEHRIEWFLVDSHALELAKPRPLYGHYLPLVTPAGVTAFGRDPASSRQVWSADEGYPGDPRYREFHRDRGWDLPLDELATLGIDGPRSIGLKYHRITGRTVPLSDKEPYDPAAAMEAVRDHAAHFVGARIEQAQKVEAMLGREPLLLAPYDAELFGHWWHEGPEWMDLVVRGSAGRIELVTPSQILDRGEHFQVAQPGASSWGASGHGEVWLNPNNAWIWPELHRAAAALAQLVDRVKTPLERRAVTQLGRELLLASASDWPFILTTGTMVPYAERRLRTHLARFVELEATIVAGQIDEVSLNALERAHPIFANLDPEIFRGAS